MATFGYAPGSPTGGYYGDFDDFWYVVTGTPGSSGLVDTIYAWIQATTPDFGGSFGALLLNSGGSIIGSGSPVFVGNSEGFNGYAAFPLDTPVNVVGGTPYWVGVYSGGASDYAFVGYDDGVAGGAAAGVLNNSGSGILAYANYTPTPGPANMKNRDGLITASIKKMNGLDLASVKKFNGVA